MAFAQVDGTRPEADSTPRVVRLGVLVDNPPFSYRDSDGKMVGFTVDVMSAVERVMGLRIERVEGDTATINRAFKERRIDMLQSFAQSPEREAFADFSFPYLPMQGSIFVRKGSPSLRTLKDLRGKKVMVHRGSLGEELLRNSGLAETIVPVGSVEESLRRLNDGENDAVLVSRLTGLATAHHFGLNRIATASDPIPGYTVRYCVAVQEGDKELLAQINEGLASLQRTGEFERIYFKWFGTIDPPPGYSALAIISAIAGGLALALAVALGAIRRERNLHRQIAHHTDALHASENRYRTLFESSREGFVFLERASDNSADLLILQVNPAAQRLLGWTCTTPENAKLEDKLRTAPELHAWIEAQVDRGSESAFEYQRAEAAPCWLRVTISPVGSRFLLSLADVTEARLADERLRRSEQAMRQTQKLEAIGTLASGIAHDFNNILTSIIGNAELARLDTPEGHSTASPLREISVAADRASRLVRQILTFSRQTESHPENLLLHHVIDEALRFLRSTLPSSLELRYVPLANPPRIHGDPTQLHQVLMNLCTNAAYAIGSQPGYIQITEEFVDVDPELVAQHPQLLPGSYARLAIKDTGHGMTPEVMQRVFEPFFTTKPPGKGTGLGLSVVHGIVQSHGGAVTVYSKPGIGTVFHVYLPVAESEKAASPSTVPETPPAGQGQHVMLVEDESAVAKIGSQILTRLGYRVTTFEDPRKALSAFEQTPDDYAAIVTDLTMPHLSGLDLAQQARRWRSGVPIVLTSGYLNENDVQRSRLQNINQLVEKPFTSEMLGHAVGACIRERTARPS